MSSKISFSGIASGIDGDAIIQATLDGRRLRSLPWQNQIAIGQAQSSALHDLGKKLVAVHDAVQSFLTLAGSSLAKSASSSNPDAVDAAAGSGANAGSATLTVTQLARTATLSFSGAFSSPNDPVAPDLAQDATVTILVGQGSSQTSRSVTINSQTTLSDLAFAINNGSDGSHRASVVNVGSGDSSSYRLILSTTQTGVAAGAIDVSLPPELASGSLAAGQLNQAQDAIVNVKGVGTVSRPGNQLNDILPGVTLSLKQTGGPVTVTVADHTDKTAEKVQKLVTALNDLVQFSAANSAVTSSTGKNGTENHYGSLARTQVDDQAVSGVRTALSAARSGVAGSPVQILADIGVTVQKDGTYRFDADAFKNALSANPASVDGLLHSVGDALGATGGVTDHYTQFQGVIEQAVGSGASSIKRYSDQIERLEASLAQQERSMKQVFAHLEASVAKLNQSGSAISGLFTRSSKG